jgi:hypothetical protein
MPFHKLEPTEIFVLTWIITVVNRAYTCHYMPLLGLYMLYVKWCNVILGQYIMGDEGKLKVLLYQPKNIIDSQKITFHVQ